MQREHQQSTLYAPKPWAHVDIGRRVVPIYRVPTYIQLTMVSRGTLANILYCLCLFLQTIFSDVCVSLNMCMEYIYIYILYDCVEARNIIIFHSFNLERVITQHTTHNTIIIITLRNGYSQNQQLRGLDCSHHHNRSARLHVRPIESAAIVLLLLVVRRSVRRRRAHRRHRLVWPAPVRNAEPAQDRHRLQSAVDTVAFHNLHRERQGRQFPSSARALDDAQQHNCRAPHIVHIRDTSPGFSATTRQRVASIIQAMCRATAVSASALFTHKP